jgi:hypothetical protein
MKQEEFANFITDRFKVSANKRELKDWNYCYMFFDGKGWNCDEIKQPDTRHIIMGYTNGKTDGLSEKWSLEISDNPKMFYSGSLPNNIKRELKNMMVYVEGESK